MPLFVTVVLDGVGAGAQPDSDRYGDAASHTLAHICDVARPHLPHLTRLGLGRIAPLMGIEAVTEPLAAFGRMREVSAGKDSTTGHWELAGLRLDQPFPTYLAGFPDALLDAFVRATGCGGVLGGLPASGTGIIDALGAEHQRTGFPIVYTSADSVFQIAAHIEAIPLETLYRLCRIARTDVCTGAHAVGRVIARPFAGRPGAYERLSEKRRDYALTPPSMPLQSYLQARGVRTVAVGKIGDLFAGVGFDEAHKTASNAHGIDVTLEAMRTPRGEGRLSGDAPTFIWTNLVDFDQEYGHRNDPDGFARAWKPSTAASPDLLDALPEDGRLVLTADHGNDPTTPGTDHSREHVPLLVYGITPRDLGLRTSFNDHAATVAAYFGLPPGTVAGMPFG